MEAEHLAPHGVPGGFKPRALSRRNSQEDAQETAAVAQPNPMDDPGYFETSMVHKQHEHYKTNKNMHTQ